MHVASITASTDNGTMCGIGTASRSLLNHVNRMTEKAGTEKAGYAIFPLPILSISDPSRFFPPDRSRFSDPTPALASLELNGRTELRPRGTPRR